MPSWVRSSLSPPTRKKGRAQVRTSRLYRVTRASSASRLPPATSWHSVSSLHWSRGWGVFSLNLYISYYTCLSSEMSSNL